MTISDERYGGQLVTSKGKSYVFDSIECLASFYLADRAPTGGASVWVADYTNPGHWIAADRAVFARSDVTRSPMGLNVVSFQATADTAAIRHDLGLTSTMSWTEVLELVRREHLAANDSLSPALAAR